MKFTASASAISAPSAANGRKSRKRSSTGTPPTKFEQGREQGKLAPEAVELDKELEAERKAEQARSPQVAPGLRLPDEGGIFLLDTYENQPQLAELQQSGSDLDKNTKSNILRAAINPLAGAKQTIELPGAHARIQSHTTVPSLYINIDSNEGAPATVQAARRASAARAQPSASRSFASRSKAANALPAQSRSRSPER